MRNRFTHNILTIDSHVRRLAQMRPRVAQKTFGHKLPSNLIPMSHWAGDVFLLTFPDAANIQAAQVDLIRVSENNCSCSENLPKYLSQPLWLLLSAICLPIANGCQSAQLYHWNLWPFHWLCPFDTQLICLYMQSVHPTICLISNLSSFTLQDDESKVYLGHPLFFLWLPLE